MTLLEALTANTDGTVPAYAWPGGYPIHYVTKDGASLCPKCVNKEIRQIVEDTLEDSHSGWAIEGTDINYEDSSLYCDHCSQRIDSAYAEDEADNA